MHFRLKITPSGQVLQLLEAYRDIHGRPRNRLVISLGNLKIDKTDQPTIAHMVEQRLYGSSDLFEHEQPQRIQNLISYIVRRVDRYGTWHPLQQQSESGAVSGKALSADQQKHTVEEDTQEIIDGVIADKVDHMATAPVGAVLVGLHAWKALGIAKQLEQLGFNESQRQAAAISVINRLCDPRHEYRLAQWFEQTALPELFGQSSTEGVQSDDRYYRVSDRLHKNKVPIERFLQSKQREIFELNRTILLYDLTNSHFEGAGLENPKAKRGHNKQKRDDCVQITVGMVFDQKGFELAYEVFEGNKSDSKSLVEMIGALESLVEKDTLWGAPEQKPLIIVDAGIASRKNLQLLREKGFTYLVNDSRRNRKQYREEFEKADGFAPVEGRSEKKTVLLKRIQETHTVPAQQPPEPQQNTEHKAQQPQQLEQPQTYTEQIILCKSQSRATKEHAILSNAEEKFLKEIGNLATRVEKGNLKDQEKIQRSIGRIQATHSRVQRFYEISLQQHSVEPEKKEGKSKKAKITQQFKLTYTRKDQLYEQTDVLAGCYVLRTNRSDYNADTLWHIYMTLTKAEEGFKWLKLFLGLRPNPHHKEWRVDGHVLVTVIAYHLLRFITYTLEQKGDHRTWGTIRRIVETHSYTTIILPTKDGAIHRIRKAGQPEECQKAIYHSLGIDWKNLPVIRRVVQLKKSMKS